MGQAQAEPHLKVVAGSDTPKRSKKELQVGSKAWAEHKCEEARTLIKGIDSQYIHLGKLLWDLYDIPVDNNPANKPVYSLFGYAKFEEFCEKELGLHYRKAYTFRAIYYRLHIELKDMDAQLRDRIIALGWTKVRSITRVLTLANAVSWVEYAEKHTSLAIEKKVSEHLEEARKKKAMEEGLGFEAAAVGASFVEDAPPTADTKKKPVKKTTVTPNATEAMEPAGEDLLPTFDQEHQTEIDTSTDEPIFDPSIDIDPRTKRVFWLDPGENELVEQALTLSKKLSGKDTPGTNLSLICLEFTATNDSTARQNMKDEFKLVMLAQVEKLLGLELLAVDPKSGNAVYASASLKKKAADG
jgi:hypothetical protein